MTVLIPRQDALLHCRQSAYAPQNIYPNTSKTECPEPLMTQLVTNKVKRQPNILSCSLDLAVTFHSFYLGEIECLPSKLEFSVRFPWEGENPEWWASLYIILKLGLNVLMVPIVAPFRHALTKQNKRLSYSSHFSRI